MIKYILLLASITLAQEYSRSEWGSWIDADRDGQNTRQEVLIAQSLIPVILSTDGKKVISGLWFCLYTGTVTTDPSTLEIDHLVPLKEAFVSGGSSWSSEKKKAFSNFMGDPHHLLAVNKNANRSKQDKDIANWVPTYPETRCAYVEWWVSVKAQWGLQMDSTEADAASTYLGDCP